MVVESELQQLGEQSDEARDTNAFFFGCAGVLAGGALGALASPPEGLLAVGYYCGLLILVIATLWFFVKWRRAISKQRSMLETIRSRPRLFSAPMLASAQRSESRP